MTEEMPLRKLPRPTTPEQRRDLKIMTRASLRMVRVTKFALMTRYEAEALSKFGSDAEDHENKFLPVDVLADLQLELPEGVASPLLECLAEIGGFRLVPIDGGDSDDGISLADIRGVMKEGSEAEAAGLAAAANTTCLSTVRQARKEVQEAKQSYAAFERKLARHEKAILGGPTRCNTGGRG